MTHTFLIPTAAPLCDMPTFGRCDHCGSTSFDELGVVWTRTAVRLVTSGNRAVVEADSSTTQVLDDSDESDGLQCRSCGADGSRQALIALWRWRPGDRARDGFGVEYRVEDVRAADSSDAAGWLKIAGTSIDADDVDACPLVSDAQLTLIDGQPLPHGGVPQPVRGLV